MGGDAVEEPAVVRNHHHAAGKFQFGRSGIDARLKPTNDKTVSGINARPTA